MSKIFWKSLLISPVVLGASLFVSGGAVAQSVDSNTDMLNQINEYSNEGLNDQGQVTSITQLRDVSPGDWAYEALRNLVEKYGCIAGYPDGTYRGQRAMTRYEFAAGLNACLQQIERLITGVDGGDLETLRRLLQEFEAELAALGARVDNLEGRVAFLEDHQFSTTTKLTGEVIFAVTDIWGDDNNDNNGLGDNNTVMGDRVRLTLNTSFTGKDTLITRLAAGNLNAFDNQGNGIWGSAPTTTQTFNLKPAGGNDVFIDWAAYYTPLFGDNANLYVAATGGIHSDYVPTINPYFEDFDNGNGALSTFASENPIYRIGGGAGAGLTFNLGWLESVLGPSTISVGYLAGEANDPSDGSGLFNGDYAALGQINFNIGDRLDWGFTYVNAFNGAGSPIFSNLVGSSLANSGAYNQYLWGEASQDSAKVTNSYGTELAWRVADWITFSGFFTYTDLTVTAHANPYGHNDEIWTWGAGIAFPDLGKEGSVLGIFGGAQPYLGGGESGTPGNTREVPYHIEAFYKYQLTDNISFTPGVIWLMNPNQIQNEDSAVIGTLRTTFTF
jgi:hypothetical protein